MLAKEKGKEGSPSPDKKEGTTVAVRDEKCGICAAPEGAEKQMKKKSAVLSKI